METFQPQGFMNEVICSNCDSVVRLDQAKQHQMSCRSTIDNGVQSLNEILLKLTQVLNVKKVLTNNDQLIRACTIIEGCVGRVIDINDSVDKLTRVVSDLNTIRDCVLQLKGEQNSLHALIEQVIVKLCQNSLKKIQAVQEILLNQYNNLRFSQIQNTSRINNYLPKKDDRSVLSNTQSNLQGKFNNPTSYTSPEQRSPAFEQKGYMQDSFNPSNKNGSLDKRQISQFGYKENNGSQQKKIFQVSETKIVRPKQIVNKKSSNSISLLGASKARRIDESLHHQTRNDPTQAYPNPQAQYINVQQQLRTIKQSPERFQNRVDDITSEVGYPNVILLTSAQNQPIYQYNTNQSNIENNEEEYSYMKSKTELSATLSQKANQLISGISGFINKITNKQPEDPQFLNFQSICEHNYYQSKEQIKQLWDAAKHQNVPEQKWNVWLQQTIKARDTRSNIQQNLISACVSPSRKQNIFGEQQDSQLSNREAILNNEYQYRRANTRSFTSDQNNNLQKRANSVVSGVSGFISRISVIPSTQPIIVQSEGQKKKFFDMAVKKKTEFNCNHPAQLITIPELYEKCRIENVPEEYWEQWIGRTYNMAQ